MKRGEARRIIDQAVEKAMGGVRKDWITINGTHVEIDGDGNIVSGPSNLKDGGSGKESKGSSSSAKTKAEKKADSMNKEYFGVKPLKDKTTKEKLYNKSDFKEVYKDHTIAFFPTERKDDGKMWFSIGVYENDGNKRNGVFQTQYDCNTDWQSMKVGRDWAKANIDAGTYAKK